MKLKTKSRVCTGIVMFALAVAFVYSSSSAATVTKTVQCGESNFAVITATISLSDKGAISTAKDQYHYTYCATLKGPYYEAAKSAKVVISGGVSKTLPLDSSQNVYPVVAGNCKNGSITAKASMSGYSAKSVTITK